MLPNVIGDFDGKLWIDFENGVCKVNASIEIKTLTTGEKKELIGVARNKKNAAVVGLGGRIRSALEDFLMDDTPSMPLGPSAEFVHLGMGYGEYMDYSYIWSYEQYRNNYVAEQEKKAEWDALEKSVIAAVADDIIVGVKGKQADIIIIKSFVNGEEK
jgi:hypothetical protein